jgi:hypothetical protein
MVWYGMVVYAFPMVCIGNGNGIPYQLQCIPYNTYNGMHWQWYGMHWKWYVMVWYAMLSIGIGNGNGNGMVCIGNRNGILWHGMLWYWKWYAMVCYGMLWHWKWYVLVWYALAMETEMVWIGNGNGMHSLVISLYGMHWQWYGMVCYSLILAMEMSMKMVWYGMVCIGIGNGNRIVWYGKHFHFQFQSIPCHIIAIVISNANAYHTIPYHTIFQCIPYKEMARKCRPLPFPLSFPFPVHTIPYHTIANAYQNRKLDKK